MTLNTSQDKLKLPKVRNKKDEANNKGTVKDLVSISKPTGVLWQDTGFCGPNPFLVPSLRGIVLVFISIC